ncbi:BlaI/MecI/CopY family transcriptional regulator [Roseivirga misakiensis]|uniref:Penicillinase repressor n=1 Tax=Roseivirga misakiensis TaxID=1563681 RepID=A0A1E5T5I8_9BACT|nr:BlaI/MecI/CopY family transcriptional regulator [Roseivirga misakiensis]OEK06641.1 penicillinase repressor [Roseivirga misakiensis]
MNLSKNEEQLMRHIWKLKKAFMKDLLHEFAEPKPATTTVLTMLKRMRDKGFIDYRLFGNSREYYALVTKEKYFSKHKGGLMNDFFDNSAKQLGSFLTSEANLSTDQLKELKKIIDAQIKKDQ